MLCQSFTCHINNVYRVHLTQRLDSQNVFGCRTFVHNELNIACWHLRASWPTKYDQVCPTFNQSLVWIAFNEIWMWQKRWSQNLLFYPSNNDLKSFTLTGWTSRRGHDIQWHFIILATRWQHETEDGWRTVSYQLVQCEMIRTSFIGQVCVDIQDLVFTFLSMYEKETDGGGCLTCCLLSFRCVHGGVLLSWTQVSQCGKKW